MYSSITSLYCSSKMFIKFWFFVSVTLMVVRVSCAGKVDNCYDVKDCQSCAESYERFLFLEFDCNWCPLDNECHSWFSQFTPCLTGMNVKDRNECPSIDTGTYSNVKAYTTALLTSAAYSGSPQQCLDAIFPDAGFDVQQIMAVRCDGSFSDYDECVAYSAVSTTLEMIVLAFQGSVTTEQVIDQALTTIGSTANDFIGEAKVYEYFSNSFNNLYPCLRQNVLALVNAYPTYRILVAGYSLGGALASLTATTLVHDKTVDASNLDLYTLGMPRVGEKHYAYFVDRQLINTWNVVHNRDIVPHLPFCNLLGCNVPYNGPFHHRREVYYEQIDNMNVHSPFVICHGNEDFSCSNGAVSDDPCTDISNCIALHKEYFGIRIGTHCSSVLGTNALPRPWNNELTYTCESFNNK